MTEHERITEILGAAKRLAQEYRDLTGKPLGITGEVAEYEAARLLGLKLAPARQAGHDAVEEVNGVRRRIQIKGRCLLDDSKPGQRLGSINTVQQDWDAVLMVLLDQNLDAIEIYEAERPDVETALADRARSDLAVSKFKAIGRLRWSRAETSVGNGPTHKRIARHAKFIQPVEGIHIVSRAPEPLTPLTDATGENPPPPVAVDNDPRTVASRLTDGDD